MRSRQLQTTLTEFLDAAGGYLRSEVAGGAEVPFELGSRAARSGPRATPLYCYRALTGVFIAERESALRRLPAHAEAVKALEGFGGLDRYLASVRMDASQTKGRAHANGPRETRPSPNSRSERSRSCSTSPPFSRAARGSSSSAP